MKRATRLLVGLLGLITALQLFHSYVTFTRHAAETADAHPAELRPKPPGWRERLPSENAPPLEREEQPVRDARGTKPHIVYLLADDLGWHGVGWRNPEVQTPNLDRLATREGLRLSQHYTYRTCSPSRSALLSGRLAHHVNHANPNHRHPGGTIAASRDSRHRRASSPGMME